MKAKEYNERVREREREKKRERDREREMGLKRFATKRTEEQKEERIKCSNGVESVIFRPFKIIHST